MRREVFGDQIQGNVLRPAKVVRVHPHVHCVDVIFLDDMSRGTGVQVLSPVPCSQDFGMQYLPEAEQPDGTDWPGQLTGTRDVLCVVGYLSGHPFVLGWMRPQCDALGFDGKDHPDQYFERHPSGWRKTISKSGRAEIALPGAGLRITMCHEGGDEGALSLGGKDYHGKYSEGSGGDGVLRIEIGGAGESTVIRCTAGGVSVTTPGDVSVDADGDVAVTADGDVSVISAAAVNVAAGSSVQVAAPFIELAADQIKLDAVCVKVTGSLAVDGGVSGGGINLLDHRHTDVEPGGGTSGPPTAGSGVPSECV